VGKDPCAATLAAQQAIDQRDCVGKLAGLMFRVNEFAIDADIEDASAVGDQASFGSERLSELCSQTDRLRLVVSLSAIGDADFHWVPHPLMQPGFYSG
jgi:hypothetical protein